MRLSAFRLARLAVLSAAFAAVSPLVRAAILSVHPTSGHGTHTSLATAISSASDGDVIYVAGSASSYGNISITKRLTIYGPGYFLDENLGLSGDTLPATVGTLSVSGSAAADTVISGLTIIGAAHLTADRVTLRRCRATSSVNIGQNSAGAYVRTSGITLLGCYLDGGFGYASLSSSGNTTSSYSTGTLISGCYIGGNLKLNAPLNSGTLRNCVIAHQNPSINTVDSFSNWVVRDSVFLGRPGNIADDSDFVAHNNVIADSTPPAPYTLAGSDNVILSDDTGVFLGTGSTDARWQLAAGSPAIGAGTGGSDCGMFANGYYVLSGIPSLPVIKSIDLPAEISNRADLRLSVEVRVQP